MDAAQTEALLLILRRLGLRPLPNAPVVRLAGGVSCDIVRVELDSGPVCVKRALPKLRVAADWRAPVERAESEVKWLRLAERLGRPLAPRIRAHSESDHLFVMDFLAPEDHPNWKVELAAGRIDLGVATRIGVDLAHIHAGTAQNAAIAAEFSTGDLFRALRLDPYFLHTASRHPDLATQLTTLAEQTGRTSIALVHGDVSPKNILAGPKGPVFLDAECAWYGDPAFDLAFCLTHLLLKCVWKPQHRQRYLAAFAALTDAYMTGVTWEPPKEIGARASALLAALLLARIDGKSPVEYLVDPKDRSFVRDAAIAALARREDSITGIASDWTRRLERR